MSSKLLTKLSKLSTIFTPVKAHRPYFKLIDINTVKNNKYIIYIPIKHYKFFCLSSLSRYDISTEKNVYMIDHSFKSYFINEKFIYDEDYNFKFTHNNLINTDFYVYSELDVYCNNNNKNFFIR